MSKEPESKFKSFLTARKDAVQEQGTESERPVGTAPSRGRPTAKRSDPAFQQVTVYIRKSTHDAAKIALLREGQKRQFSELVEHLLNEWLNQKA